MGLPNNCIKFSVDIWIFQLFKQSIVIFLHLPTELNRCTPAGIRSCVCVHSVMKYTIMYYEQTAGPGSTNFCTHMHVDKIPLRANFYPNPQCLWPSISRSKIRIEYIGKCKHEISVKCAPVFIRYYIVSLVFIGMMDNTNPHDVKGCQELRSKPCAKICQEVLAYSL